VASDDLEKSLRGEVDEFVNARLQSLREDVERTHAQVNEAFTRLAERLAHDQQDGAAITVAISEHLRQARRLGSDEAAAESSRTKAASDVAIIKAAVDDIDNQRSQADILNSLVNRAASFAPRVIFFVVKNDQALGWRARFGRHHRRCGCARNLASTFGSHALKRSRDKSHDVERRGGRTRR